MHTGSRWRLHGTDRAKVRYAVLGDHSRPCGCGSYQLRHGRDSGRCAARTDHVSRKAGAGLRKELAGKHTVSTAYHTRAQAISRTIDAAQKVMAAEHGRSDVQERIPKNCDIGQGRFWSQNSHPAPGSSRGTRHTTPDARRLTQKRCWVFRGCLNFYFAFEQWQSAVCNSARAGDTRETGLRGPCGRCGRL